MKLVSPELVWTSYNVAVSLCCFLWNVTSLRLSRIYSFKRSWELLTGVSTWIYDINNLKLKYNIRSTGQTNSSLHINQIISLGKRWTNFQVQCPHIILKAYLGDGLAPSSQTVGSSMIPLGWQGKWYVHSSNWFIKVKNLTNLDITNHLTWVYHQLKPKARAKKQTFKTLCVV